MGFQLDNIKFSPAVHRSDSVADISMNSSADSGIPREDSGGKQEISQSAVGINNMSMEHLSFPNLSCATDRKRLKNLKTNYTAFTDFRTKLNGIGSDLSPTYLSLPHATDTIEEMKYLRDIDDILTNSTNDRSAKLSLSNSPSPNHWNGENKPMIE
jgi:hypothetical protein